MFPSVHGVVSQTAQKWWEAGGATGAVAVYQPLGAASLAASYIDLSGNGNDAAPGVAPTWAAGVGWVFNGTTQYLTTGIFPFGLAWSIMIRFSDAPVATSVVLGVFDSVSAMLRILPNRSTGVQYNATSVAPGIASGVLSIAGNNGYRNGMIDATSVGLAPSGTYQLYIGAQNQAGSATAFFAGNIQATAIYSTTLTAPQVLAVSDAMAAL